MLINDLDELNIPKDLRIIPPADHSWAESRQDSGVGALAYNLFTEEVCQQLQDFQFDEIKVLGIKYNDFANENFASNQWRKRSVTLEVGVFELPESHPEYYHYNGTPILQIDGNNLGTFAPDSPKLPIGTTFTATLQPDGSSIVLKVNPESINLPEVTLPEFEPKLDTAGELRAIHREHWRKEMFDNLVGAIAITYEQRQANQSTSNEIEQFKIGSHWTAYVQPSGDFIVRNEGKRTICRGNIQTGEEIFPLSEAAASELEEMILERERTAESSTSLRDTTRWATPRCSRWAAPRQRRSLSLRSKQELSNTGDGAVFSAKGEGYGHHKHRSQSKDLELN